MSDSLITFQPAIDEPSNITPSAKVSSSIWLTSMVTCCHFPRGSVKRRSTYLTSLSLISLSTSLAVVIVVVPSVLSLEGHRLAGRQPSLPPSSESLKNRSFQRVCRNKRSVMRFSKWPQARSGSSWPGDRVIGCVSKSSKEEYRGQVRSRPC